MRNLQHNFCFNPRRRDTEYILNNVLQFQDVEFEQYDVNFYN